MPWGDRTGPSGMGPMTGRGAGYCAGYPTPGYMNPGYGYGYNHRYGYANPYPYYRGYPAGAWYGPAWGRGYGWGRGAGWGRGFGFGWRGHGFRRWWW